MLHSTWDFADIIRVTDHKAGRLLWTNLIPLTLKRKNFLQLEAEGIRQKENSERFRAWGGPNRKLLLWSGGGQHDRNSGWERLLANSQQGNRDLRPAAQITEFCQQPGWAWKPTCPQSLQIRVQLANNLISACDTQARGTSWAYQTPDLQNCEIIHLCGVKLLNSW